MPLRYPAHDRRPERIEADVAVVGAGAAGLFAALTAARPRRPRRARLRDAPRAYGELLGSGGLAAALGVDDSPDLHRRDTEVAGRDMVRSSAATCSAAMRRRGGRAGAAGVHFDADRHGNLALGLEGGHSRRRVVHAGGSVTGRRVVRQLTAIVVETPGHGPRGARAAALWVRAAAASARCEDGRAIHARGVILATGGSAALWVRTTNPPGSLGIGLLLARARRRLPRRPRVHAVPPHRRHRRQGPRGLPGHRGDPRRGRHAARRRRRALRRGARAARRGGARDLAEDARDAAARRRPRHARRRPVAFPNVVEALRDSGLDPATELVPVAPAAHYVMGGVVADLDGAHHRPGPLRGRRERVHRPARRQPPRLELAERVLRLRRAARRSPRSASPRRQRRRPPRRPRPRQPARDPRRRSGATRASCATPRGCTRSRATRTRWRGSSRRTRLREESRGAHAARRLPGDRSGAGPSALGHPRRGGAPALRALDLSRSSPPAQRTPRS